MGKYFTLAELTASDTARRRSIDNTPSPQHLVNLNALIDNVLDPARQLWGKPVTVTSGYRCPALNRAVGGVAYSQHLTGQAADITAGGQAANAKLFEAIRDSEIPFDQLIWEKGNAMGPQWVHVSFDPNRNRRQVLKL